MKGSLNHIWETRGQRKNKGNKKNGKKHHVYAVIVLLLAAAIIIIGGFLLFYIQEIEVSGNEYCDSQEIVNCVQNDKLSDNSLYVVAKYSMGKGAVPKCLDSLKVRMKKSVDTADYGKRKGNYRVRENRNNL